MTAATACPIAPVLPLSLDGAEADFSLLHRFIASGDPDAFAQIVHRHGQLVYTAALRILGDHARAQDVSQETFFRLMRQPRLVTQSLAGWLHRSATHLSLDVHRSEKARRHREEAVGAQLQESTPDESSWLEISLLVDQALDDLPEPSRSIVIRHFLQGVPQADLAAELELSPATVSRRIKAALMELQQGLAKRGIMPGMLSLVVFFALCRTQSASASFLAGAGKMQLLNSIRHLRAPTASSSQPQWTSPLRPRGRLNPRPVTSASTTATVAVAGMIAVILTFAIAIGVSFYNHPIWPQSHPQSTPEPRLVYDP